MIALHSKRGADLLRLICSVLACVSVVQARCLSNLSDSNACMDIPSAVGTGLLQTKATQATKIAMPSTSFFEEEAVQAPGLVPHDDGEDPGLAPHDVGYGAVRAISPEQDSALPETVPKVPDDSDQDPDAEMIAPLAQAAAKSSVALIDGGDSTDEPQRQLFADSEPASAPIDSRRVVDGPQPQAFAIEPPLAIELPRRSLAIEPPLSAPPALSGREGEGGQALLGARAEGGATESARGVAGAIGKAGELGEIGEGRNLIDSHQRLPVSRLALPIENRRTSQSADWQTNLIDNKRTSKSADYQAYSRWQLSEKERLMSELRRMQTLAGASNYKEDPSKLVQEPEYLVEEPQAGPQAAQPSARHEAEEIPLRYAPDQFVQEAGVEFGPKHGGHCTPKCTWSCDKPVCDEVCEPICKPPKCETRCNSITTAGCAMECKKPHCAVVCPKKNKASGPSCTTKCSEPQCKLQCPQSQSCRNVCEQPLCEYDCKAPSNCPIPKCKMVCEVPKKCRSSSFHETLPPLQAGQVAVQTFRAPAPTRQTQEAAGMQASSLPMLEVHVRSPMQQRKVSIPVLQDLDGADAFEPF